MNESDFREILKIFDNRLSKLESTVSQLQQLKDLKESKLLRYTKEELKEMKKGVIGMKATSSRSPRKDFWSRAPPTSQNQNSLPSCTTSPNSPFYSPSSPKINWWNEKNEPGKFEAKWWKTRNTSSLKEEDMVYPKQELETNDDSKESTIEKSVESIKSIICSVLVNNGSFKKQIDENLENDKSENEEEKMGNISDEVCN